MKPSRDPSVLKPLAISVFLIVFGGLVALLSSTSSKGRIEHEERSAYSHIRIRRTGSERALMFVRDNGREVTESRVDISAPHHLLLPYARGMFASYLYQPHPKRVLIVGLGGGAMVHFLQHYDPDIPVDVIEIDPAIVQLADKYFGVRTEGNVQVITGDAFEFLETTDSQYDVIFMDAFLRPSEETDSTGVPSRLKTLAFYETLKQRLTPEGLVAFNLNRHGDTQKDIATIASAFAQVDTYTCPPAYNLIVIACPQVLTENEAVLTDRAKEIDRRFQATFSFAELLKNRSSQ
jgi:spermidine synthase